MGLGSNISGVGVGGGDNRKRGRGRPSSAFSTDPKLGSEKEEAIEIDPNEPVYCSCRQIAYG